MAKKKTILDVFCEWMEKNSLPKDSKESREDYKSYINATYNFIMTKYEKESFIHEVLDKNFPYNDYIDLLTLFTINGDLLYSLTVYDKMYDLVCKVIDITGSKELSKRNAAFVLFKEFLYKSYKFITDNITLTKDIEVDNNVINEKRELFQLNDLHKLDGMESLLTIVDDKKFVKLAVDNSFFFAKELVNKHVDKQYQGTEKFDKARYTSKEVINKKKISKPKKKGVTAEYFFLKEELNDSIYIDDAYYSNVYIDKDGNDYVRDLIKNETGITISKGEGSLIQNTIISHIWGRAYDPRFFMNLWNIVLIPAWANSLMDKNPIPRSLASKMQATYMKICHKLYKEIFENTDYWEKMKINKPDVIEENDIVKSDYLINLVDECTTGTTVAISKKKVAIK